MAVNWGLAAGNNALGMFQLGNQLGQQVRAANEKRELDNALSVYATNRNDPAALQNIARADPRLAIDLQGKQQQQQLAQEKLKGEQREQQRDDLPIMGRLLEHAKDDASYQQSLQLAQRYGIDTSGAPPQYDPQWVASTQQMVQAIQTAEGQEALSTAGKLATDAGLRPGTQEFMDFVRTHTQAALAQPYIGAGGETRLYQPQLGGIQQQAPAAVTPYNPDEWEVVDTGGGGGNVTSGFLDGL